MDRLRSMAVFAKVVEQGSFTAAARHFRISATMVGQHVRALEHWLDGPLLHRTTRRQSLTELGRTAHERFRLILEDVEEIEAMGSTLAGEAAGVVRVTTPTSFGVHCLAPRLKSFLDRHPRLEVDLVLSDRRPDMVDQGFDLVVQVGELADSSMKARALAPYRSVLCAAPAYLKAHGAPATPADLSAHRCLGFANPVAARRWRLLGADGEHVVPVDLALQVNNGEALRMAALEGLGIIMQPEILVDGDIRERRLAVVLEQYRADIRPVHVLFHPHRAPNPKVRAFVDFLVENFAASLTPRR